ncbi:hypothetical protein IQ268_26950 [Oculatella sp. LEGE 06141]|uniref:slr1957 family protein n=1 Tax=Oculatella sp. LEGE 06141 TaxID=1828648 RepID=UPI00187FE4D4|nr:hypothetical protein [Oculatella sp. LEGE 06141]MBE9182209.1 hypothetical protein [Oculatella sp. LEGE 06141]
MNHFCDEWIQEWCFDNGWTDPFKDRSQYWAFPPHGVMPLPIPVQALRLIKSQKGFSVDEQRWCLAAIATAIFAAASSYVLASPMPLVAAFGFCAFTVAQMDVEEI